MTISIKGIISGVFAAVVLILSMGCNDGQAQYQATPAAQPVISGTCVNSQQQVVEDYKCDPNWIAQQRQIAQQRHDDALLESLLIYHMIYTPQPYIVGAYIPRSGVVVYNAPPRGYSVQPRNTYVTNVTNHTVVVNKTGGAVYQAPRPSAPSGGYVNKSYSSAPKPTSTTTPTNRGSWSTPSYSGSTTRSTPTSKPYSSPSPARSYSSPSFSRPSSGSFGSSSMSRRR